ncbi:MAG: hypothetical protein NC299_18315 [Lachnospiraceae bacterium]|nr:hypothetical protein [Lachnospiraceae bacterium]
MSKTPAQRKAAAKDRDEKTQLFRVRLRNEQIEKIENFIEKHSDEITKTAFARRAMNYFIDNDIVPGDELE